MKTQQFIKKKTRKKDRTLSTTLNKWTMWKSKQITKQQ